MKYTFEQAEKSRVKIVMTFDAEELAAAEQKAYIRNKGKYVVNGYRKGKAPKKVIEMNYGPVFSQDAIEDLYEENFDRILDENKDNFTAIAQPKLELGDSEANEVVIIAMLPVKPEVELGAYTGLDIVKTAKVVTDADVDAQLQSEIEKKAELVPVEGRACKMGDTVEIDFSGSVDGEKFAGGTAERYSLELGSGSFIPGFEEQVAGMNAGEEKDVVVTFPAEYHEASLAGKEAVFAVKLHVISEKKLPTVEEYVEKLKMSVEDYKAKVRARLEKKTENENRDKTENAIVEAICKGAKCEIPEAMIDSQIEETMHNFEMQLSYSGMKLADYCKYMGTTVEQMREQTRPSAEKNVLAQLVIDKLIRTEKIEATEEEIEAKIAQDAASVDKAVEEYKKNMKPQQIEYIRNDIIITKLFAFLEANNNMIVEE